MISNTETWSILQAPSSKVRISEPYPITHRFKVSNDFVGKSLLDMMTTRFPFRSPEEWERRIEQEMVGINGEPAAPDAILKSTDKVFHHNPAVIEPSVPDEVRVLKEEQEYIMVYKPAPMPMHPGGRYNRNTLTWILKEMGYDDLKIVHRLDGVTSGLVLFARTKGFAKKAMECFRDGLVRKVYYAEVSGLPPENEITIDMPIRRKVGFVFETNPDLENAKPAQTRFTVIERRDHTSLIKCEPVTGRTHQIRLHLEKWGYPIVDDPIYGPKGDRSSKKTQNVGISLLNAELRIPELGIDYQLEEAESYLKKA